jgi:hypothetical protein
MDLLEHPFEVVAFRLYSLSEAAAVSHRHHRHGALVPLCLLRVHRCGRRRHESSEARSVDPDERGDDGPMLRIGAAARYTACYRDANACRVGCCDENGGDYE